MWKSRGSSFAEPETVPTPPPMPPVLDGAIDLRSAEVRAKKRRRHRHILLILLTTLGVFVIGVGTVFGWYMSTRKPLSELPGLSRERVPHYSFSIYGMNRPTGVAVNPSGDRIYVTESDGTRVVRIFDRTGKELGTLQPPKSSGTSHVPVYVAVNPLTNDVYVSDRPTQSVYVYNSAGVFQSAFVTRGDLGGNWQPLGLAFDQRGYLYVTDVSGSAHRVLVFQADGTMVRVVGSENRLSFPNGIAIDKKGGIYVGDSNNGRVVIVDAAGNLAATINRGVGQGDLGLPRGIAIDTSNRLYVVDTSAHAVKVYLIGASKSPLPRYIGSFGEEGQLDGTFEYPNGVAIDSRARIYVTDRENNRVQVWSY